MIPREAIHRPAPPPLDPPSEDPLVAELRDLRHEMHALRQALGLKSHAATDFVPTPPVGAKRGYWAPSPSGASSVWVETAEPEPNFLFVVGSNVPISLGDPRPHVLPANRGDSTAAARAEYIAASVAAGTTTALEMKEKL